MPRNGGSAPDARRHPAEPIATASRSADNSCSRKCRTADCMLLALSRRCGGHPRDPRAGGRLPGAHHVLGSQGGGSRRDARGRRGGAQPGGPSKVPKHRLWRGQAGWRSAALPVLVVVRRQERPADRRARLGPGRRVWPARSSPIRPRRDATRLGGPCSSTAPGSRPPGSCRASARCGSGTTSSIADAAAPAPAVRTTGHGISCGRARRVP